MTKAQSLRTDAKLLDREAGRLQRKAQREAVRGCVFTAEALTVRAVEHQRMAAQFRCDAIAHEVA